MSKRNPGSSRGKREAPETGTGGEQREAGMVESVHADKGYGFLKGADGTIRFFHRSACRGALERFHPGDSITFVPTRGPKGPRAILVQKLQDEDDAGEEPGEVGGGNA